MLDVRMSSRWDRILDVKRTTLVDQLMTEAAKILWEDLGTWPPPIEEMDGPGEREFPAVLAAGSPVPPRAAFLEGIRLARFDLRREFEAFDEYVRNRRWSEAGLEDSHKPAILFLTRYLTEALLSLREATGGRAKREDLVLALDRLQKRFEAVA